MIVKIRIIRRPCEVISMQGEVSHSICATISNIPMSYLCVMFSVVLRQSLVQPALELVVWILLTPSPKCCNYKHSLPQQRNSVPGIKLRVLGLAFILPLSYVSSLRSFTKTISVTLTFLGPEDVRSRQWHLRRKIVFLHFHVTGIGNAKGENIVSSHDQC